MNIVIIEDEKLTAESLKLTIKSIDVEHVIVATLYSVEEALEFFISNDTDVDLIFSDIELGDGLTFEIYETINNSTPIIFCTAFSEYALQAFKASGIDYILKPFSKLEIEKALSKFKQITKSVSQNINYENLFANLKMQLAPKSTNVIIKQNDKIIPLPIEEIVLFYFENGYSFAYTFSQKTFILSKTLEELELSFSPQFFRANRQHLINRKAVKEAEHFSNRKLEIKLLTPFKEEIIVGKLKITAFTNWLSNV
jgi:DNA-binding LytR/AlgR family response regulator